jgi:hypothetical protein
MASVRPRLWTVKRVGTSYEVVKRSYAEAVAYAEQKKLDSLILCNSALVASWTNKGGLQVLNEKLSREG